MTEENGAGRSVTSKMAGGILEQVEKQACASLNDYDVVKRFTHQFNTHAAPALKEAGVRTKLRAVFEEKNNACEITAGSWFSNRFVTTVNAYDIRNGCARAAKTILDRLPVADRKCARDNMERILNMK